MRNIKKEFWNRANKLSIIFSIFFGCATLLPLIIPLIKKYFSAFLNVNILVGVSAVLSIVASIFAIWSSKRTHKEIKVETKDRVELKIDDVALAENLPFGELDDFLSEKLENWKCENINPTIENGELIVTGTSKGLYVKSGLDWRDYKFSFDSRIINGVTGFIVRVQDLDNYYFFQIGPSFIRPHIKYKGEWIYIKKPIINQYLIKPKIYYHYEIVVEDEHITINIDSKVEISEYFNKFDFDYGNQESLKEEKLFPKGSVGFRQCGGEKASFKDLRVKLLNQF